MLKKFAMIMTLATYILPINLQAKCIDELKKLATHRNDVQAFNICLSEYVKIPTLVTKAQEFLAKEYFEEIFKTFNIPYLIHWSPGPSANSPKRFNIVATLPYNNQSTYKWNQLPEKSSIILLNHIDVIHVHPDQWTNPELVFSGKVDKDGIWGRGSLDMKGIAIMQLISMIKLKLLSKNRTHDIHFVAVADEEDQGSGAREIVNQIHSKKKLYALSKAKMLLNEGGGGFYAKKLKSLIFTVDTEQKGGAWLSIKNTNLNSLLYHLALWHFLKLDELHVDKKFDPSQIKIEKIETPKAKTNVQASKLFIKIKATEALLESFFKQTVKLANQYYKDINIKRRSNQFQFSIPSASHGSLKLGLSLIEKVFSLFYSQDILESQRLQAAVNTTTPSFLGLNSTEATTQLIQNISRKSTPLKVLNSLSFIPSVKRFALKKMSEAFGVPHAFKTSCSLTAIESVQNYFQSKIDCRTAHSQQISKVPQITSFVRELRAHIPYLSSVIDVDTHWDFSKSSHSTNYFKKLTQKIEELYPDSIASAYLNIAGSDSRWFRSPLSVGNKELKPIDSYGFSPLIYSLKLAKSIHAKDEHFPADQVKSCIENFYTIVRHLIQ